MKIKLVRSALLRKQKLNRWAVNGSESLGAACSKEVHAGGFRSDSVLQTRSLIWT